MELLTYFVKHRHYEPLWIYLFIHDRHYLFYLLSMRRFTARINCLFTIARLQIKLYLVERGTRVHSSPLQFQPFGVWWRQRPVAPRTSHWSVGLPVQWRLVQQVMGPARFLCATLLKAL